jgi:hypothetical protein
VTCSCGHTLFGQRRRRHQVVRCPKCGKPLFILPNNVYPPAHVEAATPAETTAPSSQRTWLRAWRLPLLAALTTLVIAVVFFVWVWPHLGRKQEPPGETVSPPREEFNRLTKDGERDLAEGSFALALEKFDAALKLRRSRPELAEEGKERQRLNRFYWQSYLLAKKLRPPLADLLKEASEYDREDAWHAQFKQDYQGKWVVFDDQVYRDPSGRPLLLHEGEVVYQKQGSRVEWRAHVALDDVQLLQKLPLHDRFSAERWIFAARLASFTREGDAWVIRFDPDRGVLLTDAGAVTAWKPALSADPDLPSILERQKAMQLNLPEP